MNILVIDIGGSKVKILASGQTEPRSAPTGKDFTPARMVEVVRGLADGWDYEAVSIGYPGLCGDSGPKSEPGNLGGGWVGFHFPGAFGLPVKVVNDGAMQALGSYEGGRMLFLGLGTGVGSALIAEHVIVTLELGRLPYRAGRKAQTFGDVLGREGLDRQGEKQWRGVLNALIPPLMEAFQADYVVVGGGNAERLKDLPHGVRVGHNQTAFRGGFRLWEVNDVPVLDPDVHLANPPPPPTDWRLI
jgi:predicted NBD/HSP70 family sugar kinase